MFDGDCIIVEADTHYMLDPFELARAIPRMIESGQEILETPSVT